MMWEKVKLGDICKYVTSGGTPKSSIKEYYEPKQIPWLKTKEVNYCRIYETEAYISKDGLDNSSAKMIPQNSVIVAMYGQGDTAGRVAINKIPLTTNQACCNLIIDETKAYYEFVYYQLVTLYEKMVSLKNGGAQPNLNAAIIKSMEIKLPPLKTQRYIADILSSYDNLIENNQKQIKLLEEAAQRLYKEWFVDLRFPGHENTKIVDGVPEGWSRTNINEILTFHRGYDLTKNEMKAGRYPVVGSTTVIGYHNEFKIKGPGIVTGRSGSLGKYQFIWDNFWPHNTSLYISDYKDHNIFFVYSLLQTVDFASLNNGGAIPTLNRNVLSNIEVIEPTDELQEMFAKIAEAQYRKIRNLEKQNNQLKMARDVLLPKLMSGEVEV